MIGIGKVVLVLGLLCAFVELSGCKTTETATMTETATTTQASSAATASTASVAVSVSKETTTTTRSPLLPPPSAPVIDVLSGEKKPCGTVAADAPKFVKPEIEK